MKTFKNLYPKLCTFEHLRRAYYKARKNKRCKPYTCAFDYNLEREILTLQSELKDKTYTPGIYNNFTVYEPKKRIISAAPFRDRVVHHALVDVLTPIYEPRFIHDSYACRVGKGTHRAINRCQEFMRKNTYFIHLDVVKFFPSIDHDVLTGIIRKHVRDKDIMWLISQMLTSGLAIEHHDRGPAYFPGDDLFACTRLRGLPIGNLTSQFFANVFLNEFDIFAKEKMHCKFYVRYADDASLFSNDKKYLAKCREECAVFMSKLRLALHLEKAHVRRSRDGVRFLGFRIFPTHRLLDRRNVKRFRRKLDRMSEDYRVGSIELSEVKASVQGWIAHAAHGDTWRLRNRLFKDVHFTRETMAS
ncbi:reverse transcriptase domain-containing protein [Candidatus Hydrogenedentota bacterium]